MGRRDLRCLPAFLNEDPWERLRAIRKEVKKTKLQMLLRGQNLLGYKNYADDVVADFVTKSVENGIDILRLFDALNDVRNLKLPSVPQKQRVDTVKRRSLILLARSIPWITSLTLPTKWQTSAQILSVSKIWQAF